MKKAFTLIELLVVVAIIGILAGLLLPVLTRAKEKAHQAYCINNHRQLNLSWQLYADDFNEFVPGDWDLDVSRPNWISGFLDFNISNANNVTTFTIEHSPLFRYFKQPKILRCPSDKTSVRGIARPRSISMNDAFGMGMNTRDGDIEYYTKFQKRIHPKNPSNIFVFIDENPASIGDGIFSNDFILKQFVVDFPLIHGSSSVLSYGDGRVQSHKWVGRVIKYPKLYASGYAVHRMLALDSEVDVDWLVSVGSDQIREFVTRDK